MNEEDEFSIIETIKEFGTGNSSSRELVNKIDDVIQPGFDKYCKENHLVKEHEKE